MATLDFRSFPDPADQKAALAAATPSDVIESGWIPPEFRDTTGQRAHADVLASTPPLLIAGRSVNENVTKVVLWECWKPALGKDFLGVHQITTSCVGAGGGNALFSLASADRVKRKDRERAEIPFWLLPYGVSRMLGGLNDRGGGSFGSTFAQAVRTYGHTFANQEGLPKYQEGDGLIWGEKAELDWSQGRKIAQKWLEAAKPHLVQSTARCRSTDDVREAIKNYFSVTCASNWGGLMRCPTKGEPAVLLNRRAGVWNHQMSVQGWTDHPTLGELFYILNQWGQDAHGRCPSGAPPGGFWIAKNDMAYIVDQEETFAFSQFNGFPAVDEPLDFGSF